ncbi:hypothetical protein BaRGS_00003878 [Batillaria attramentaria]|uniref:Uncharacterized protein n=1 Tax=Batillaria attramentaria TaxID=370345 RepID=A0ABD0LZ80_9CAEN
MIQLCHFEWYANQIRALHRFAQPTIQRLPPSMYSITLTEMVCRSDQCSPPFGLLPPLSRQETHVQRCEVLLRLSGLPESVRAIKRKGSYLKGTSTRRIPRALDCASSSSSCHSRPK